MEGARAANLSRGKTGDFSAEINGAPEALSRASVPKESRRGTPSERIQKPSPGERGNGRESGHWLVLGRLKSEEGLALLLQVESVPGDDAQVFGTGAQQALFAFVPLEDGLSRGELVLQILNLGLHFVAPVGFRQVTNPERSDHDQNNNHYERPVQGDPNWTDGFGLMLEEAVVHGF